MNSKPKFVIVSPIHQNGGTIVLHKLCLTLQNLGYDSRIFYSPTFHNNEKRIYYYLKLFDLMFRDFKKYILAKLFPSFFINNPKYKGYFYNPVRGCKRKFLPFVDKNTIVIYPELIENNPLRAKNTVFWLLYHYNKNELQNMNKCLVMAFREIFNNSVLNPENRILHLTNFDFDLFNNPNEKRQGNCYIIRKGKNRKDLPKTFDGPIIDNLTEPQIAEVFKHTERCYSYDTQTGYCTLATLCGCLPIIVPEEGKKREDYISKYEINSGYGLAYGDTPSEIEYALKTQHKVKEYILQTEKEDYENVKNFANMCLNFFKS
ncbi:MAG: hypothetical protein J6Z11_08025 [Candidatus Riflebacteria bacterium]|nr:hypothetical protein [Candidatus Riflebacteria bacterium]